MDPQVFKNRGCEKPVDFIKKTRRILQVFRPLVSDPLKFRPNRCFFSLMRSNIISYYYYSGLYCNNLVFEFYNIKLFYNSQIILTIMVAHLLVTFAIFSSLASLGAACVTCPAPMTLDTDGLCYPCLSNCDIETLSSSGNQSFFF